MEDVLVYIYIKTDCVEVSEVWIKDNECIIAIKRHISNISLVFESNDDVPHILEPRIRLTINLAIFDLIRDKESSIVSMPYINFK